VNAGRQRQRVLELLDEALDALDRLIGSPSLGDEHSWNRYYAELAYARVEEARKLAGEGEAGRGKLLRRYRSLRHRTLERLRDAAAELEEAEGDWHVRNALEILYDIIHDLEVVAGE
jgi:hypothetical protein